MRARALFQQNGNDKRYDVAFTDTNNRHLPSLKPSSRVEQTTTEANGEVEIHYSARRASLTTERKMFFVMSAAA